VSAPAARPWSAHRSHGLLVAGVALAGVGALVLRLAAIGSANAPTVFALTYLGLGTVSVVTALPAIPERRRLGVPVVIGVGLAAVAVAASSGPRIPMPNGPEVLALDLLAAVAEEAFFRRLVYGGLLRFGAVAAVGGSAVLFAAVHIPIYGPAVFWVDLGAGLLFAWQRWATGGWGTSAATHAAANLLVVLR
jgi:membrane protease YdiL (CAAX protease family)